MNIPTSAWDLCCDNFCLFGPKEAAYFSEVLSDKVCPLHSESCVYCRRCLARLSARNKLGLFGADSRELLGETCQADWVQCSRCDKECHSPFLLGICWEITRQADRVQCNCCCKQYSSLFLLPYLESAQTVVLCRFWPQCSHSLSLYLLCMRALPTHETQAQHRAEPAKQGIRKVPMLSDQIEKGGQSHVRWLHGSSPGRSVKLTNKRHLMHSYRMIGAVPFSLHYFMAWTAKELTAFKCPRTTHSTHVPRVYLKAVLRIVHTSRKG
jgi:hypothetical protein